MNFSIVTDLSKSVSKELGIVFGYSIVTKVDGEPYYDLQEHHIPDEAMLEAAAEYMAGDRTVALMHKADVAKRGTMVFCFPLTEEIAKSLGISASRHGLLVGAKVDKEILAGVERGEYTGFSIGGEILE